MYCKNLYPNKLKLFISVITLFISFCSFSQTVTTFVGGAGGYVNGEISQVKFNAPWGVTADTSGNIYVADRNNNCIRKISKQGFVSTFAGSGVAGLVNGKGVNARFYAPNLLCADADNNIYVADQGNNCIRKITPDGTVTTLAGNGIKGNVNGPAASAEFNQPSGVAVDANKNVYVADQYNNIIRKISNNGIVSLLAGSIQGYLDGTGANARFNGPNGITTDDNGNVFVAEIGNNVIRKITPAAVVTTFAGNGIVGFRDGTGSNAEFNGPLGLVTDKSNNIFLADLGNKRIRKITPAQVVTTIAGNDTLAFIDGAGSFAKFGGPFGITLNQTTGNIYVADATFSSIRKVTVAGVVSTLAGIGAPGFINGTAANAEIYGPNGVAFDTSGNLFIADRLNNRIRKVTPSGMVSNFSGTGVAGHTNGNANAAQYSSPTGLAFDSKGNLFVGDNNRIRKITPSGTVSDYAGNGNYGFADGSANDAEFWGPGRMVFDKKNNLYVADFVNNRIRKITTSGVVSTYAGSGASGYLDGNAATAQFNRPDGICIDSLGNLYIADYADNHIRKISTSGIVTTVAGNGIAGHVDGNAANAEFNGPGDVTIDAYGNLYTADEKGNYIRKITAAGIVSTVAGNGIAGIIDSTYAYAEFNTPRNIVFDSAGNLYVCDFINNKIREVLICNCLIPPANLKTTKVTASTALLKWDLIDCAIGYKVQYRIKGTSTWTTKKINTNKDSIKITGLLADTTYQWHVATKCNQSGTDTYSAYSEMKFFTTKTSFAANNSTVSKNQNISIKPNPAHSFININFLTNDDNTKLSVINAQGETVIKQSIAVTKGSNSYQLNIASLNAGVYTVLIQDKTQTQSIDFIKN